MQTSEMQDFVTEKLRTLYDAEKQLTKALPKMAKAASDEELADGFRQHAEQTREQMARIEQIFQTIGVKARGMTSAPMQALIEEGQRVMSADMDDSLRDIGLASSARTVEHFEMACYDALVSMVQSSKQTEIAQLLQQTLREEAETDKKLATVSKRLLKEMASAMRSARRDMDEESGTRSRPASARGGAQTSRRSRSYSSREQSSSSRASRRWASSGGGTGHLGNYTTDHGEIRHWTEERGGKPACVEGTGGKGDIGMLRLEFPGKPNAKDSKLHEITWDEFFEKFDERGLALVYQDKTARGQKSNFNKIVSREAETARTAGGR